MPYNVTFTFDERSDAETFRKKLAEEGYDAVVVDADTSLEVEDDDGSSA